jgi:hypothetical protein
MWILPGTLLRTAVCGHMHTMRKAVTMEKAGSHVLNVRSTIFIYIHVLVAGLHPILWSPGDWREIPVSQQKSLGNDLKSFDRKELIAGGAHSKIEAIFSNNGGTWERLNSLPSGSTLMGSGFYLKKTEDGKWVLLLGAVQRKTVDNPLYCLWKVLDTKNLASLDFDGKTLDVLRAIVCFSRQPDSQESPNNEKFRELLENVRMLSIKVSSKSSTHKDAEDYLQYLVRESIACQYILNIMRSIRDDTHSGYTVKEALVPHRLEEDLQVSFSQRMHLYTYTCSICTQYMCIIHMVLAQMLI